jgi:hypothetical protein
MDLVSTMDSTNFEQVMESQRNNKRENQDQIKSNALENPK